MTTARRGPGPFVDEPVCGGGQLLPYVSFIRAATVVNVS
jgi:hypothetical protein